MQDNIPNNQVSQLIISISNVMLHIIYIHSSLDCIKATGNHAGNLLRNTILGVFLFHEERVIYFDIGKQ